MAQSNIDLNYVIYLMKLTIMINLYKKKKKYARHR